MDPNVVLLKTAKGREEIEKRTLRLDARRRTLLILVDGKSSAAELAARAGHLQEPMNLLDQLLAEGFIEASGGGAATGTSTLAAGAGPPAGQSLDQLKRRACKEIERLMGPGGEAIALKIERAATYRDFLVEAQKTRDALHNYLGARKAEEFWKSLQI